MPEAIPGPDILVLILQYNSADLTLQGAYDRPVIAGHADIERGDVNFEGRRYRITRGAIGSSHGLDAGRSSDVTTRMKKGRQPSRQP